MHGSDVRIRFWRLCLLLSPSTAAVQIFLLTFGRYFKAKYRVETSAMYLYTFNYTNINELCEKIIHAETLLIAKPWLKN